MTDEPMLLAHLDWLEGAVLPAYIQRGDDKSARFVRQQIANIQWRLTTGQAAPTCGWRGLYANHPADCNVCRINRERIGQ